jgi:hypothetical protein
VSGNVPATFPNTIKVVLRRDASANGSLKLFFAPAIGTSSLDLTATARASTYAGVVTGFTAGKQNLGMLPVTYDYNSWMNFLKTGADPDGNVTTDANGNPVLQVYPSIKQTGNFGLLSLDDSHVGASTVADWIANGASPADVQTLIDHGLVPTSPEHNAWDWNGENGFKATNVMDINQQVGAVMVLPLFLPKSTSPYQAGVGNGSNFDYNIAGFVSVRIMPPDQKNRQVIVQPTGSVVPTATFGSLEPAGSTATTTQTTIFAPPMLTN